MEGTMFKAILPILIFTGMILTACGGESVPEKTQQANDNEETNGAEQNEKQESTETDNDVEGALWEADGELGVVLSHGAAYDADSWEDQGEQFAENNVTAFAVEDTNDEELVDAAEWLKEEQGVEKVAVLGASAGGASAIEAVEKDDTVFDKVALLSPGSDATSIKDTPVLVVYSEEEGFEDLEENQPENLETLAISGDAHAQEMFQDDEKSTEVMKKITAFLEE